jgi:predicted enzyme related to lactoylglutathione lyase
MALHLHSVTLDAADPERLAEFWSQVTGYDVTLSTENFAQLAGDGSVGPGFMFIRVPEAKGAKNRMHIDLGTTDLEAEVDRVLGLGATLEGRHDEFGVRWATLRDPEGNEFCIGLHP